MMAIHRKILVLGACAAMTACGSIPKKTFTFSAIDWENGVSQSCLIVIDDDWDTAVESERVTGKDGADTCSITIEFKVPEIEVTVVPFKIGMDLPRSRSDATDYQTYMRTLGPDDPETHLFILEKKRRR